MSIDSLIATIRANAVDSGPLQLSVAVHDGSDLDTSITINALMSPASKTVQQLQGQGMIDGRRATFMCNAADISAADPAGLGRELRAGDEVRIASGDYAGVWVVDIPNLVRGGWQRADLRLERMAVQSGMQERRS